MGVLKSKLCEDTHERCLQANCVRIPMGILTRKLCEDTHEHFDKKTL